MGRESIYSRMEVLSTLSRPPRFNFCNRCRAISASPVMTGPLSRSPNAISKSGIPLSRRELPIGRMARINTEPYAEDGCHDELVRPLARCRASGELLREPLQPGRLLHAESGLRR